MGLSYEFSNVLGAVYHRGSIRFSPDGFSILSPVGNKVVLHDLKSNRSSALPTQVNYNINQLCIHPKGVLLLAASEKSHLYMISMTCGKLLHMKEYREFGKISNISFSPDGRYYCVCGSNIVLIYITPGSVIAGKGREIMPFRLFRKYRIGHESITSVGWSADSEYLCVASSDMTLNVVGVHDQDKSVLTLRGHTDTIIGCHFANRTTGDRRLFSLSKNCQLFVWDEQQEDVNDNDENQPEKKLKTRLRYNRTSKHYVRLTPEPEETKQAKVTRSHAYLTASEYNIAANIMIIGYNTGHYGLYTMSEVALIHELDSEYGSIDTISINPNGDWIALGSSVDPEVDIDRSTNKTQSRLVVWEWQSKSYIYDQIGSGATMSNMHECVCYSLDGTHVVSGNLAGQIKVWNSLTGESIATFGEEHKGPIKSIKFVPNKSGKVIVSASLDGSLRAYDLNRIKNFRTFQSPVPDKFPEFICLDVDTTGEFIAAGTYNYFEIYLYSLQTGKFLEYLTGHEGPVSGVAFSPTSNLLVSTSWDCTVRIWNLFEGSKCMRDTVILGHEVITVAFRPDGNQFAVSLSNGQIVLFNTHTADQFGAPIDGLDDLGATQLITDSAREKKKYFISLSYSADGTYIIGGGKSNFICIYHASEKILIKKIAITFNMSMDGVFDYVSNRRRKEFGYNLDLLDSRKEERTLKPISLPGVRKGDLGERGAKPVIAVYQIVFSPSMRSFSCATTEGVLTYSLDISRHFDPYKLMADVDPYSVESALKRQDYGLALVQAIQLNDRSLFRKVLESVPTAEIDTIVVNLDLDYVKKTLDLIGRLLPDTKHIEFYLNWAKTLLYIHGMKLKTLSTHEVMPIVRVLHQNSYRYLMDIKKNCDYCKYSLQYLTRSLDDEHSESSSDALMTDVSCDE